MAFKIPTVDEIGNVQKKSGYEVSSLFKSSKAIAAEHKETLVSSEASSTLDEDLVIKQARLCSDKNDASSFSTISTAPSGSTSTKISDEKTAAKSNENVSKPGSSGVVIRPVAESEKPIVRQPKANSIVVSPKQKGNPVLKFIRNVPWEYGDIVPDYQFSSTSCALFLSVRYHNLKPNYIHERLRQLANSFVLRVLLVHVDVKDCDFALKELAKICILADCTMVLAFTQEEAGRYIEIYKSFESKPAEMLMEKTDNNYLAKITDTLTSVKQINKTNAATLISAFGSFKKIAEASEKDLSLCPGMGPQKATRLHKVLRQPFLKENKRHVTENAPAEVAETKS